MKRIFVCLLACMMLLSLCACGTEEPQLTTQPTTLPAAKLQVGFGEAELTPDWPIGLSGFGNEKTRISTGNKTFIYAHVLAVTDPDGSTAVIIGVDLAAISKELAYNVRSYCQETYGIPMENVMISAAHQHSVPIPTADYIKFSSNKVKSAIDQAMENRGEAEMYYNSVTTEAMSFVRNYWTNDGTIWGPNYGDKSSGLASHESESDKQMQLLKFTREDDKDIILVNFQAHPHMGTSSSDTLISADWPGVMRYKLNKSLGVQVMYLSGAGGNLNSGSSITEENISKDFTHHGERAAEYVESAEGTYTKAEGTKVVAKEMTIAYAANPKNWEEPTKELTIGAIAIGNVAFTVHPYEMFDTNGMELKAGTVGAENYAADVQQENPFAMTVITTMSNGSNGYIPSQLGFTNGGYSTEITYFAEGTGEKLVTDYLNMLHELKNS